MVAANRVFFGGFGLASIGVQIGAEVIANVGIPWNSTAIETAVVKISKVPR